MDRGDLGDMRKRLAKLAEKKIKQGVSFLGAQANAYYKPQSSSGPTSADNSGSAPSQSHGQLHHQSHYSEQQPPHHSPYAQQRPTQQRPAHQAQHLQQQPPPPPQHVQQQPPPPQQAQQQPPPPQQAQQQPPPPQQAQQQPPPPQHVQQQPPPPQQAQQQPPPPQHVQQQPVLQPEHSHLFLYAPPPTPFSEPFPESQTPGSATSQSQSAIHQPSNQPLPNAEGPIITLDLLNQMQARVPSAIKSLGSPAVTEARKGISRLLSPTHADIELFGNQLKRSSIEAVEPKWNDIDDLHPCFAISYVQQPAQGRYKFSDTQWSNFHEAVKAIAHAGVKRFRVWLDQCLWLRDASQSSWAHTGVLPYVLWPVIALGAKAPGAERTIDSYHRMWPFVEQIAALWGMGLVITSEYRDKALKSGVRSWLSFNIRVRTEPDVDIMVLLRNIFHGAADMLKTGWQDDVRELKEMARANVMYATDQVIIGSDWKQRFQACQPLRNYTAIDNIQMPITSKYLGGINIYLDGSRTLKSRGWTGVTEWLSGNDVPLGVSPHDITMLNIGMGKYNIITNVGEYQLLHRGSMRTILWLLVAMQGSSSYFSRGRVAWTKVLTGIGSCNLAQILGNNDVNGLQQVLQEQLNNNDLRITSARKVQLNIEWL